MKRSKRSIHICRFIGEVIPTKPGEVKGRCEITDAYTQDRCRRRAKVALRFRWGCAVLCEVHAKEESES